MVKQCFCVLPVGVDSRLSSMDGIPLKNTECFWKTPKKRISTIYVFFGWHPAETKEFYDICDELGITVWTNFSFATQEFRTDQSYLDKVTQEIQGSVISRRNHPSNIMWMGAKKYFLLKHMWKVETKH